jgi:predicted nucleic acid-binding protein
MSRQRVWRPKKPTGPPVFVLDVSVPLAWSFAARGNPYTSGVMAKMTSTAVIVPVSWSLELATLLRVAEQAGTGTSAQVDHFLAAFNSFEVVVDRQAVTRAWGGILALARAHSVTVLDAAYLELALRRRLPLATTDTTLTRAASAANVPIYTP